MTRKPPIPAFEEAPLLPLEGVEVPALPTRAVPPKRSAPPKVDRRQGHRKRLRERFQKVGTAGLADYELLELIMFRAIPQGDVKDRAKELLEVFGDFNHVIAAPPARLREVPGIGDAVIAEFKIVEAAAHRFAQAAVIGREVLSSWDALMRYCKTAMAHRETEQFRVLFLDRKNVLIADEPQQSGTVDHVPVYPREVVKRALELNASALILVHNHPSGDPEPSGADIAMTHRIADAADALGIALHDHVVIGKDRDASFRQMELI